MHIFDTAGTLMVAGVLVLLGIERVRYMCVGFVLLLALAAYPSLQFQWRHIFHLEFLVFAVIACGWSLVIRMFRNGIRQPEAALRMAGRGQTSIVVAETKGETAKAYRAVRYDVTVS